MNEKKRNKTGNFKKPLIGAHLISSDVSKFLVLRVSYLCVMILLDPLIDFALSLIYQIRN